MKIRTIDIRETPLGWLNCRSGRYHKHAIGALRAVRGLGGITIINWYTTTPIGRAIVLAIATPNNP